MIELTKPSERLEELEQALSDYSKDPSQRKANIFATAANAHLEWTFKYHKQYKPSRLDGATDLKSFRAKLLSQHKFLQMMCDLADASDHRILTRPHDPPRVVTISTAAYYEEAGALRVRGFDASFATAAEQVINFWRNWLD